MASNSKNKKLKNLIKKSLKTIDKDDDNDQFQSLTHLNKITKKKKSFQLTTQNHIETLYTSQDQLWINHHYLPFIHSKKTINIKERQNHVIDRFDPVILQKYGLPSKIITITGNGGTGKSYTSIAIAEVSRRSVYMASTGMGGLVIQNYLTKYIVPNAPQCFKTVYKFFGINVDDYVKFMEHVFGQSNKYAPNIYKGDAKNLKEFWLATINKWIDVCWELQANRTPSMNGLEKKNVTKWITPSEYEDAKKSLKENHFFCDQRSYHERTLEKLLITNPKSKIPDMLLYDTFIIDEASRESPFFLFLLIVNYYYIHQVFKTDEIDKLPTICLLGSVNQSMTMNPGLGEEKIIYDILDHDMISITTNSMFDKKYILRRFKQYNRRIGETDNPKYKALVMEFNSMLENNDPKAQLLLKELKNFSSVSYDDFFYVKNEDNLIDKNTSNTRDSYNTKEVPYLRICDLHADNMTVEANYQEYTKNNNKKNTCLVTESLYCRKNEYNPTVIYNANSFFCPAFEDVKYNYDHWDKIDKKINNDLIYQKLYLPIPPKTGNNEQIIDTYSATRIIHTGMWYIITHNCRCQLTMFSGFLNDFIQDYNLFYGLLNGDAHFLCASILAIINSLLDYLSLYIKEPMSELIKECHEEKTLENEESITYKHLDIYDKKQNDYLENKIIVKHLINIQMDVMNTKNSFKENNSASSSEIMSILQTTLNECCNYANMYRFANLLINYNVKYEYGWVFINLQKLSRVLLTGYECNYKNVYKLNITIGKTFSLTMGLTYVRLNKDVQKFPIKPLLYKKNHSESRYYKRKSKVERNNDVKRHKNEEIINSNFDIDDDNFIFEIASAEEDYYSQIMQTDNNIIDDFSENLAFASSTVLNDLYINESSLSNELNLSTIPIQEVNESPFTVIEIFPLKPALTSTVASLQGSELDTPHCLFVKKNSDAHNLIVGTSRAKNNIENLKFCFETDVNDTIIKPLSNTKVFVQKTILSQVKSGFLEQL